MAFPQYGALIERVNSTTTSGGTLNLANNSQSYQRFTGSSNHTVVLPEANAAAPNNCPIGLKFMVMNRSTGSITVNTFGGSLLVTVAAGEQKMFRLTDNSTSTGSWDITVETATAVSLTNDESIAIISALSSALFEDTTTEAATIKVNPEEIGGNYWLGRASMPTGRRYSGSFTLNGYAYISGGQTPGPTASAINERFSDDSNYWLGRASLPAARWGCYGAASLAGYLFGGNVSGSPVNSILAYDDALNSWATKTGTLSATRQRSGVGVLNDNFYVVGGAEPAATATVQVYLPVADAAYSRTSLPATRLDMGIFNDSKRMFVVAGVESGASSLTNYEFLEEANSWKSRTSMPSPGRNGGFASAMLGAGQYAAGNDNLSVYQNTGNRYQFDSDSWQAIASVTTQRSDAPDNAVSLNGNMICAGGGDNLGTATNLNETYVAASFLQVPIIKKSLATPTSIFAAAALNGVAAAVPARMRTDGDAWKYFEANKDSVLKLGETLKYKFAETGFPIAGPGEAPGPVMVGTTETYSEAANIWMLRTTATFSGTNYASFPLNGKTHFAGSDAITNAVRTFDEITNSWGTAANLPSARIFASGSRLNGYGYAINGDADGGSPFSNSNYQYNGDTNSWATKGNTVAIVAAPSLVSVDGRMYATQGLIAGGSSSAPTEFYDDVLDAWANIPGGNSVSPSSLAYGGSSFVSSGKGHRAGDGTTVGGLANFTETWNTVTRTWSARALMPRNRYTGTGGSTGAYGFAIGGSDGAGTRLAAVDRFNHDLNSWSTVASLSTARASNSVTQGQPGNYRNYELQIGLPTYLAALGSGQWVTKANMNLAKGVQCQFTIGGRLYAAYGNVVGGVLGRTDDNQAYDELLNFWMTETPGINGPADMGGGCSTSTLNGRGWVNGHNAPGGSLSGLTSSYDAVLKSWSSLASGGGSGQGNANFVLNGFGYSASGGPGVPAHVTSTYRYNPSTNSWSTNIATLAVAHYGGTGGLVNGFQFLAGGSTGATSVNERFNDAGNSWTTVTSLPSYRESAGTFVLKDGWHVVGGYNGAASNPHIVYKDSLNSWSTNTVYPLSIYSQASGTIGENGYQAGGNTGSYTSATYEWASAIQNVVIGAALKVGE